MSYDSDTLHNSTDNDAPHAQAAACRTPGAVLVTSGRKGDHSASATRVLTWADTWCNQDIEELLKKAR